MLPKLNDLLQRAFEAGLIRKLEEDFRMHNIKPIENYDKTVLTMEHMYGVFVVLCTGLLAALGGFVSEHLIVSYLRCKRDEKKSSFWFTIEKAIYEPDRAFCLDRSVRPDRSV